MYGALAAKLMLDNSGFVRGFATAEKRLDRFEKRMAQVPNKVDRMKQRMDILGDSAGAVMGITAALGGALVLSGKKALSASGDLEKYRSILLTLYQGNKQVADEALGWATDFANRTPYLTNQVIDAYVKLEAYGISAQKSLGTIGDTAAGMGKDLMQAVEAIADARQGEFERLKEFGIKARVEGDKVKFMYSQNGKDMVAEADKNSQAMIASTIEGIWNSKYSGSMERLSTTWQGLLSTLGGMWWNLWTKVGEAGALDAAKEQVQKLIDYLGSEEGMKTAEQFGQALADLIRLGGNLIDLGISAMEVLGPFIPLLTKLSAGATALGGGLLIHSKVLPRVLDLYSGGARVFTRFADGVETSQVKLMLQSDALKMSAKNAKGFTKNIQLARSKTAQFGSSSKLAGMAVQAGLAAAIAFTTTQLFKLHQAYKDWRKTVEQTKKTEAGLLDSEIEQYRAAWLGFREVQRLIQQDKVETPEFEKAIEELQKLRDEGVITAGELRRAREGNLQMVTLSVNSYRKSMLDASQANNEAAKQEQKNNAILEEKQKKLASIIETLGKYGETFSPTDISQIEDVQGKIAAVSKDISDAGSLLNTVLADFNDQEMTRKFELGMISADEYLEHRRNHLIELVKLYGAESMEAAAYANETGEVYQEILDNQLDFERKRLQYGEISLDDYRSILQNQLQTLEDHGLKYTDLYSSITDELAGLAEERNTKLAEANQKLAQDFQGQADTFIEFSNMIGQSLTEGNEAGKELLKNTLLWMVKAIRQKVILAQISALAEAVATGGLALPKALAQLPQLALLNTMLAAAESGITSLASGGIIKQEILARVGDNPRSPEVVSPLHELLPMIAGAVREGMAGAGGNGAVIRIEVPVNLDGRQIAHAQAEYNRSRRK